LVVGVVAGDLDRESSDEPFGTTSLKPEDRDSSGVAIEMVL
jgi:hypothetical protein